jgi:hypothetical protein
MFEDAGRRTAIARRGRGNSGLDCRRGKVVSASRTVFSGTGSVKPRASISGWTEHALASISECSSSSAGAGAGTFYSVATTAATGSIN